MSHWEYYGDNQHKLDLKVILEDILKSTTDPKVSKRFEVILEEIERLEKKIKDLESDIEIRYESLHTSIEETLGEL